jgi:hypothetical protein
MIAALASSLPPTSAVAAVVPDRKAARGGLARLGERRATGGEVVAPRAEDRVAEPTTAGVDARNWIAIGDIRRRVVALHGDRPRHGNVRPGGHGPAVAFVNRTGAPRRPEIAALGLVAEAGAVAGSADWLTRLRAGLCPIRIRRRAVGLTNCAAEVCRADKRIAGRKRPRTRAREVGPPAAGAAGRVEEHIAEVEAVRSSAARALDGAG